MKNKRIGNFILQLFTLALLTLIAQAALTAQTIGPAAKGGSHIPLPMSPNKSIHDNQSSSSGTDQERFRQVVKALNLNFRDVNRSFRNAREINSSLNFEDVIKAYLTVSMLTPSSRYKVAQPLISELAKNKNLPEALQVIYKLNPGQAHDLAAKAEEQLIQAIKKTSFSLQ